AWVEDDLFNSALSNSRNPANLFRHQSTESAYVADHRSSLYGVWPQDTPFNDRRCWFQPGNSNGNTSQHSQTHCYVDDLAQPFLCFDIFSLNVHSSSRKIQPL